MSRDVSIARTSNNTTVPAESSHHCPKIRNTFHSLKKLTKRSRRKRASSNPPLPKYSIVLFTAEHSPDLKPHVNPFVFDINIHIIDQPLTKIMKRVLLDTGADLNIISFVAYRGLGAPLRTFHHSVYSLAGETAVVGEIYLTWNFLLAGVSSPNNVHGARFFVLADTEMPAFDMILGHRWITEHMNIFDCMKLVR